MGRACSGGGDAARFAITAAGALTFSPAPDFDLPTDSDGNNIYAVQIRVSDGRNNVDQLVNITVNNSREGIAVKLDDEVLEEILFQRRYSLWAEAGHRWIDLRRTGKLDATHVDLRDGGTIIVEVERPTSETNWDANN
ncbi:MAG: RagB/SusD family nutrient uptake outer membrane protein [Bacteroidia bacterium]|nr:RagB/SusD family nutrient uptake outer membrane protein [Bacteroidia bacterium]